MQCRRASILADTSPARAWSTWLAPAQFHNRSIPEPHTWQALSQTPPLLAEPTRIGAGTSERVGMCLKHGALAGSHGTHWRDHMEPITACRTTDARTARPASLHITGPSQCPRVDKPHPAAIAGTRPAVARRPGKVVAQAVWDCPGVAYWYNRQFTQDRFNWYDV